MRTGGGQSVQPVGNMGVHHGGGGLEKRCCGNAIHCLTLYNCLRIDRIPAGIFLDILYGACLYVTNLLSITGSFHVIEIGLIRWHSNNFYTNPEEQYEKGRGIHLHPVVCVTLFFFFHGERGRHEREQGPPITFQDA